RQTISLSPAPVAAVAATAASGTKPVNAGLSIERVDATTAIVRSTNAASNTGIGFTWYWPLAALIAMVIVLGLVRTAHTLFGIASLLWQRKPRFELPTRPHATPAMVPVTARQPRRPEPAVSRPSLRYNP